MRDRAKADFTAFVEARYAALFRTAYLLTGDFHQAQDLLQTALLKVCPVWRRVKDMASPEAYVRKVMTNQWISWRRRRSSTEVVTDRIEHGALTAGPEDATVESQHVWRALALLPRQQRAVIVLRYYEDLSEADIADVLGIAPSTVKTHARMALRSLSSQLGQSRVDLIANGEAS